MVPHIEHVLPMIPGGGSFKVCVSVCVARHIDVSYCVSYFAGGGLMVAHQPRLSAGTKFLKALVARLGKTWILL